MECLAFICYRRQHWLLQGWCLTSESHIVTGFLLQKWRNSFYSRQLPSGQKQWIMVWSGGSWVWHTGQFHWGGEVHIGRHEGMQCMYVTAGMTPLDFLVKEAQSLYQRRKTNPSQVTTDFWRATGKKLRRKWQQEWDDSETGRWTYMRFRCI